MVEKILPNQEGVQTEEEKREETVVAPSREAKDQVAKEAMEDHVEVLAKLPGRAARLATAGVDIPAEQETGDIIAVRQGNVFGTSFHPELTDDARIHAWWLLQIQEAVNRRRDAKGLPLR